ncbi:hypothetical protein SLE2022_086650 [Rubroshorea leprosula]
MGNCSLKGVPGPVDLTGGSIRVLTDKGKILEFRSPTLVGDIVRGYPGYGIFRRGHASLPLPKDECLINGFYYLLHLQKSSGATGSGADKQGMKMPDEVDWMRQIEPPKMSSADFVDNLATGSALEVLPSQKNGVWRVKLVINTKQLEEILSEQVNTEALIEKMRMAATTSGLTPRRTRNSNSWVVGWKPTLFKAPTDNKAP